MKPLYKDNENLKKSIKFRLIKIIESVKNTEILNGLSPIPCFLLIY